MSGLIPTTFRCREHPALDLTDLVATQVELEVTVSRLAFARERDRPLPFRVRVRCPGGSVDGHLQEFSGSYTPSPTPVSPRPPSTGPDSQLGHPDVAWGSTPDPDDLFASARDGLSPVRSLERTAATARFLVSTVTVFASALGGFGLVALPGLSDQPGPRATALVAVGLAVAAVVLSLIYLTTGVEDVHFGNLVAVQDYLRRELHRARWASAAGVVLAIAVAAGGAAALWASATSVPPTARLDLSFIPRATGHSDLVARAQLTGLDTHSQVAVTVTALATGARPLPLYVERSVPGADGTEAVNADLGDVPKAGRFVLQVSVDATPLRSVEVPDPR